MSNNTTNEHASFMRFLQTPAGKEAIAHNMKPNKSSYPTDASSHGKSTGSQLLPQRAPLLPQRTLDPHEYKGGNRKSKKNKKTEKRKTGKRKISKTRSIRKSRKNITGGMLPGRLRGTNKRTSSGSMSIAEQNRRLKEYDNELAEHNKEIESLKEKGTLMGKLTAFLTPHPGDV
jgi:hypothetical protein